MKDMSLAVLLLIKSLIWDMAKKPVTTVVIVISDWRRVIVVRCMVLYQLLQI